MKERTSIKVVKVPRQPPAAQSEPEVLQVLHLSLKSGPASIRACSSPSTESTTPEPCG